MNILSRIFRHVSPDFSKQREFFKYRRGNSRRKLRVIIGMFQVQASFVVPRK